jgi:hypothetical protein
MDACLRRQYWILVFRKLFVRFIGTQRVLLGGAGSTTGVRKRMQLDVEGVMNPSCSGSLETATLVALFF